jgi:hypothetical protein
MTSRERVAAVFAGEPPDGIPIHHIGFSSEVASSILGRDAYVGGGIQRWREARALWDGDDAHREFLERSYRDAIDIALAFDHDLIRPGYWRFKRRPTRIVDENTFLFEYGEEKDWQVLRYDPPTEQCRVSFCRPSRHPTFEDLEQKVERAEKAVADYAPGLADDDVELRALREFGDERVIKAGGAGVGIPYEEIWLEAMMARPDLVARHLDVQAEYGIRDTRHKASLGFKYLFGGIDFAGNDGPMYSPAAFRDLILPRLKRVSEACRKAGARHLFASDGNLWPVADALFKESGIDGYYEIDRQAGMDLNLLRDRFPDLILIGNMSSSVIHLGSREDVVSEVRSCLETALRRGRIIAGVSNYLVPGTPPENAMTLIEIIRTFRKDVASSSPS